MTVTIDKQWQQKQLILISVCLDAVLKQVMRKIPGIDMTDIAQHLVDSKQLIKQKQLTLFGA